MLWKCIVGMGENCGFGVMEFCFWLRYFYCSCCVRVLFFVVRGWWDGCFRMGIS